MAYDIDMQKYAGANTSPAAVDDKVVDTNLYQQEVQDNPEPLAPPPEETQSSPEAVEAPAPSPQAENFRALREEVDRIKTERETEKREHQLQLDMLRANMAHQQPRQPEPPPRQAFEGMKDDDVPNVGELKREWQEREANYQARLEELQVQQMHPDYAEVIEKYALPLVKQKPHLAEGIQGARNKALFAYELGKMAQAMSQPVQQQQKSENAQRIVDNARKPGTLSQAGGQAALSKADYFASMSDQKFMEMATKNLEGI